MPDVMHSFQSHNEDPSASESEVGNQTPLEAANNDDSTPLELPEHFGIYARKHTVSLEIFACSNDDKSIMKLKDRFRLDQPIRSKPKLIVIRQDSEYAMHTVQGKYQAKAN